MTEIDIDDDEGDVLVSFEHEVTLIRVFENVFLPSVLKISADLYPSIALEDDDFEIAMTKTRFWLDSIASRCIVFARGNDNAMAMLIDENGKNRSNNQIMLTPYEPMDYHIAALFQSKLTSLSNDAIVFGSVEIRSSNMVGLVVRFVGNSEDSLPDMAEWIGDRSYFESPWWMRDDASTLDVIPPEGADLNEKPKWAYSLDFLNQTIRPSEDVVLHHEFRPIVIDGDTETP